MALLAGTVILVLAIIGAAWNLSFQRGCRIDPIAVDLGHLPKAEGFWSPDFNVENLEQIFVGYRPEDLTYDSQGRVYTGHPDGWIKRIEVDGTVENHTYVGGTVLGLAVGQGEEIYYVDPDQGLFKVSIDGDVQLLSSEADGTRFLPSTRQGKARARQEPFKEWTLTVANSFGCSMANGVVVAKDGTVYFTDASTKFGFRDYVLDVMEGRPNGRVLKYDPSTSSTSVLVKNMSFPNGVALSENEDFLLISETTRARVVRYWLKGEKEGTLDTFIDGLPGYPDNIQLSDGNFYMGLPGKRTKGSDWALRTPAKLLRCLAATPTFQSLVNDMRGAVVIVVSPEGKLVKKYEDPTGKKISFATGGAKVGDFVYFSSLAGDFVGRLKV